MDFDLAAFVKNQLENEFMTGGVAIVVLGAIMAYARNVPSSMFTLLQRRLITTIDVTDHDQAFYWIQDWLSAHEYTKRARLLTASTRTMPFKSGDNEEVSEGPSGAKKIEVIFSPAPGLHFMRFNGRFVLLNRVRKELENSTGSRAYHETFVFRTPSRDTVKQIIEEAQRISMPSEDKHVAIYRENYNSWVVMKKRSPRVLESVVLDGGIDERLVKDLKKFFSKSEWYKEHGIPYQRGYLLYGPPGNGKTSLVLAIASMFNRDIFVSRASATTDEYFQKLMTAVPEHGIVLIEDVDCIFDKREVTDNVNNMLTFSGFINGIDGMAAPQGRVLFLTTNHIDKLDGAMIRPGRCDKKFYFGNATPEQAKRLFARFFPTKGTDGRPLLKATDHILAAGRFAEAVKTAPEELSMAQLQEHILTNAEDVDAASRLEVASPVGLVEAG